MSNDLAQGLPTRSEAREHLSRIRGLSTIEVVVGMAILSMVSLFTLSVAVTSIGLDKVTRSEADAIAAANWVLEEMQAVPLSQVFASFNRDAADDPAGPGTAVGGDFTVLASSERVLGALEGEAAAKSADLQAALLAAEEAEAAAEKAAEDAIAARTLAGTILDPVARALAYTEARRLWTAMEDAEAAAEAATATAKSLARSESKALARLSAAADDDETTKQKFREIRQAKVQPIGVSISFPIDGDGNLVETESHTAFGGQTFDLDGDGVKGGNDCRNNYKILPVVVRCRWLDRGQTRSIEVAHILTDR